MPATTQTAQDPLSLRLAALADPTRRAMLVHLARRGPTSAGDLGQPFAMTQPAISKHLKVLERAGLISRSRSAQFRPCRLVPAALAPVQDWIADLKADTEAQLDRLEAYLDHLQSAAAAAVPGSPLQAPKDPS
jgi:DNA-binding transcriptional ArsR family regulator